MRFAFAVVLVVLTSACACAARPKWNQLDGYTFEKYLTDFSKVYSAKEHATRRALFEARLGRIRRHNSAETSTYKMGVNHMTDYTDAELKGMRGSTRMQAHEQVAKLDAKYGKPYKMTGIQLPPSVDYRNSIPPVLTAVKDQGMCGSCWAHGSTEQVETYGALTTGQLFVLSTEQVTQCAPNPDDCGGNGGCGGSIAELAFAYVFENNGLTEEWRYPYTSYGGVTGTCTVNATLFPGYVQLSGYVKLPSNEQNAVLESLAVNGPLAVNVDASNWFLYESGIYDGCNYANNITIDHVVQLVGYGTDATLGQEFWIVRNSWSAAFGEDGYIRVLRTPQVACGWNNQAQDGTACKGQPTSQWTCGMCGIVFDTSYPTVPPPS